MYAELWAPFFKEISYFTIAVAAIAWLIRLLFSHNLSKELEAYRAQLHEATLAHTEQLQAVFAVAGKEHEIRFGTLHSRRADALHKIFAALQRAAIAARLLSAMADMPGFADPGLRDGDESLIAQVQGRSFSEAMMAAIELRQVVGQHRLLLESALIDRLVRVTGEVEEPSCGIWRTTDRAIETIRRP